MPLFEFFKNLFGKSEKNNLDNDERISNKFNYRNELLNPGVRYNYEDSWRLDENRESNNITKFNIFTDPLEMHKYFEEQMNDLFKSFGMFGPERRLFYGDFDSVPNFDDSNSNISQLERLPDSNLRDQLLKPGYEHSKDINTDTDLDGKLNAGDLDLLYKDKLPMDHSVKEKEFLIPQMKTYGQSITSKTIRGSDGSYETHRTVRDHAGNEETTITKQLGDKKYSVTIRTDKNGRQEKIEDLKNIDEKELSQFTNNWQPLQRPQINDGVDWNKIFESFFK